MKVYIGADHGGFKLKESIKRFLKCKDYSVIDEGNKKFVKTDDYPDYGFKVAKKVSKDKNSYGILFCRSAEGMCIVANKVKKIRAVAARTVKDAKKTREHNDANVLCLSGDNLTLKKAQNIVTAWLKTEFTKEKRNIRRINKIKKFENA